MADDIQEEVRSRTLQLLLDKVHADTYPSSTMLDIVERLLSPDDVDRLRRGAVGQDRRTRTTPATPW